MHNLSFKKYGIIVLTLLVFFFKDTQISILKILSLCLKYFNSVIYFGCSYIKSENHVRITKQYIFRTSFGIDIDIDGVKSKNCFSKVPYCNHFNCSILFLTVSNFKYSIITKKKTKQNRHIKTRTFWSCCVFTMFTSSSKPNLSKFPRKTNKKASILVRKLLIVSFSVVFLDISNSNKAKL